MDDVIINQIETIYLGEQQYVISTSGNIQNVVEEKESDITGSLTATVYPKPDGEVKYKWEIYNSTLEKWQSLVGNRRFSGANTNVLTGNGKTTGSSLLQTTIRCEITIDDEVLYSKEYYMPYNKKGALESSESSIGDAIQLITTKTFPVATEAFMKNELWLFGMGFFVLTFLGVFLHWLFRRGRR